MNESVLEMINRLHARLDDLTAVVKETPFELNGYDKRLDKIDDQIYLLEVEIEKKTQNSIPLKPLTEEESESFDAATEKGESKKANASSGSDDEHEGFLTDSAKETIADATKKLNSVYKEGKEIAGEFSEAFGDVKGIFGKKKFFK